MTSERRKSVLEQKQLVTGKVSELNRYIAFGLLTIVYALFTSESNLAKGLVASNADALCAIAVAASASVVLDYIQYFCGVFVAKDALANAAGDFLYDDKSMSYALRGWCFWAKQVTTALASVLSILVALQVPSALP